MGRRTNSDGCLHIPLATLGSAGDVFPLIELGIALQKRGHKATIITNESFAEQIRGSCLSFIGMGTKFEAEQVIADPRLWQPSKGFECIVERVIAPNISRLYEIIREHRPLTRWSGRRQCASGHESPKRIWRSRWPALSFSRRYCAV